MSGSVSSILSTTAFQGKSCYKQLVKKKKVLILTPGLKVGWKADIIIAECKPQSSSTDQLITGRTQRKQTRWRSLQKFTCALFLGRLSLLPADGIAAVESRFPQTCQVSHSTLSRESPWQPREKHFKRWSCQILTNTMIFFSKSNTVVFNEYS